MTKKPDPREAVRKRMGEAAAHDYNGLLRTPERSIIIDTVVGLVKTAQTAKGREQRAINRRIQGQTKTDAILELWDLLKDKPERERTPIIVARLEKKGVMVTDPYVRKVIRQAGRRTP